LFATASRAGKPAAGPWRTMVVEPGDTLWGIATREMPRRDGQAAVAELRRLNRLEGYGVDAGDRLVLPPAR
jgi:LysM repeat protein